MLAPRSSGVGKMDKKSLAETNQRKLQSLWGQRGRRGIQGGTLWYRSHPSAAAGYPQGAPLPYTATPPSCMVGVPLAGTLRRVDASFWVLRTFSFSTFP